MGSIQIYESVYGEYFKNVIPLFEKYKTNLGSIDVKIDYYIDDRYGRATFTAISMIPTDPCYPNDGTLEYFLNTGNELIVEFDHLAKDRLDNISSNVKNSFMGVLDESDASILPNRVYDMRHNNLDLIAVIRWDALREEEKLIFSRTLISHGYYRGKECTYIGCDIKTIQMLKLLGNINIGRIFSVPSFIDVVTTYNIIKNIK